MNILLSKFKETFFAILPITVIVLLIHFTLVPLEPDALFSFLMGAALNIIGLAIFLFGIDIGITPIGRLIGTKLVKTNRLWMIALIGLGVGFTITLAEPAVQIIANQIGWVTNGTVPAIEILLAVSTGVGVLVMVGLIRVLFDIPLYKLLLGLYGLIFILALFIDLDFFAIAFDVSGATTGAMTVPFILALAVGVSSIKKDGKKSEKDSFGLVALASAGAIISIMVLSIFKNTQGLEGTMPIETIQMGLLETYLHTVYEVALESILALLPIILIFIVFQIVWFKINRRSFMKIVKGLIYVFIGVVLFMTGVYAGFMNVGTVTGIALANMDHSIWLMMVAFVLGISVILAEPAVYILTHQVEDITSGYVPRQLVLITLAIGVGFALVFNVIRILNPQIALWHLLVPGYIIALGLMFFTPKLFVGIAFDSGGVASGPMAATFILAFSQGVAFRDSGHMNLGDAFGMIALIAFVPIITIEILGIIYKIKSKKENL